MKWKTKFIETMKRYKHAWVFLYALIYMPWFWFLEKHVTMNYHVVQTALDEEIPFIEYFIVPYMLWFVFIAATFLYFFVTDVQGFYKLAKISFAGMTIFLIICSVFPNGQDLRPVVFERDNIFVDAVRMLYRTDTCTNVFPSLHVFNTLCACIAIHKSQALKKHMQKRRRKFRDIQSVRYFRISKELKNYRKCFWLMGSGTLLFVQDNMLLVARCVDGSTTV